MEQTLIKLSETHYIVVDDSEIRKHDMYYNYHNEEIVLSVFTKIPIEFGICKKITHSFGRHIEEVENRPLSEIEEDILGYSVEKMADDYVKSQPLRNRSLTNDGWNATGFVNGFNAHEELVKDKFFTVEDMEVAFAFGVASGKHKSDLSYTDEFKGFMKEIEKAEWKVTFDEQGKLKLI